MSSELAFLKERLETAIGRLPAVSSKRMFGCDCYFRDGTIFAMVWKEGRLAVKLPDETSYATLRAVPGSEPWSPGGRMVMGAWLLVPEEWSEDDEALKLWVQRAHAQASSAKKTSKKRKTTR